MSSYTYNGQLFTVNAPFDLAKNEIRNAVIQNLGTAPSTPSSGQIYFDTSVSTDYSLKIYTKHGNTAGWLDLDPFTTQGDILIGGTNGFPERLAAGTAEYVLTAKGAGAKPVWQAASAGFSDPMTTIGDIIIRNGSNVTSRLGGSTTNGIYFLSETTAGNVAGAPSWVGSTGSGVVVLATSPTLITPTLGVATATSINGLTISATVGTLGIANTAGAALNTTGGFAITLAATAASTVTMPASTSATMLYYTSAPAQYAMPYAGAASGLISYAAAPTAAGSYAFVSAPAGSAVAPSWVLGSGTGTPLFQSSPSITTPTINTGGTLASGTFGVSSGATINVASGASLTVASGATFTYAGTPTNPTDVVNKQYVDNIAIGLTDWKESVRVATTANIATLAGGAPNTLDGVTLVANDRILVKNQTTPSQNGIYYVSTLGTGSNGTWTRATDADSNAEVTSGLYVYVEEGTAANKGQYVLNTPNPIVVGTTGLTFVRFNGGTALTAGNGIDITGDTISVKMPTTTYTQWGVVYASSTSALAQVAAGTTDKALVAVSSGAPVWSKLTLTNPATTATLTLADNSSLITTGAFATTFAASAAVTHTLPGAASKLAYIPSATTPAQYQIAYFNSTTGELANLAVNSNAEKRFLNQASSGIPAWSALSMTDLNVASAASAAGTTVARKYTTTITGSGTAGAFTITHNLGTRLVQVQVYDADLSSASGNLIGVDITSSTVNTVTVTYGSSTPGASTHTVIVIG